MLGAMPEPTRTKRFSTNILAWLAGKGPDDFKAIRAGKHLLFPDAITYYDGEPREDPVMIREPKLVDRTAARIDAITYVAKRVPKSSTFKVETFEDACKFMGGDEFDAIERAAVVARCTHDPNQPSVTLEPGKIPPPWRDLTLLIADYSERAIYDLYERMALLGRMFSPRLEELTEEEMWAAANFIATKENASPLGAMGAATQLVFLIWACKQASRARAMSSSSST